MTKESEVEKTARFTRQLLKGIVVFLVVIVVVAGVYYWVVIPYQEQIALNQEKQEIQNWDNSIEATPLPTPTPAPTPTIINMPSVTYNIPYYTPPPSGFNPIYGSWFQDGNINVSAVWQDMSNYNSLNPMNQQTESSFSIYVNYGWDYGCGSTFTIPAYSYQVG